ncbi:MAG: ERCC4 domain-containing protein [Nanoarchaeota archaeon]|nr:ERCC4 domain-containing protein [Nanoarchaeota archaeon]
MFHNIFEKLKSIKENKQKPRIIADIHEKDSLVLAELKYSNEIILEIVSLEIGDYLIQDTIIERKTIQDFASSIINKRLLGQISQMQSYNERFIIIEGEINNLTNTKISANAIRGAVLKILSQDKIPIIFTKDYLETAKYLILLAKQKLKPDLEPSLHSKIPKTLDEQKLYILQAFPNIGPKKARALIKRFQTLENIFNADENDLKEIIKSQSKEFKKIIQGESLQ